MLRRMLVRMSVVLAIWVPVPLAATELTGSYSPSDMLERFKLIGEARLGTDSSGNVTMIFGSVTAADSSAIPYEALFMMCDDQNTACANILLRHDWIAGREDVWCAINSWKDMGDYEHRATANFAFDKVRLIREQIGFGGYGTQPRWMFVQLWQKELRAFHALTQQVPGLCN